MTAEGYADGEKRRRGDWETGMGRKNGLPAMSPRLPVAPSLLRAWRTFCALELPSPVGLRATDHANRLRHQFPNVSASWNRDGKFHLTLKFIGEIPQERIEHISLAADRATNNFEVFNLIVKDVGAFPIKGTPKVLWLGINDQSGSLVRLQTRLEEECEREGFIKERRGFHPHLTLARLRKPEGARAIAAAHREMGFSAVQFEVAEILVLRSELSSKGSEYSVISTHQLGARASRPQ